AGGGRPPDDPRSEPRDRPTSGPDGSRRRRTRPLLAQHASLRRGTRAGPRSPPRPRHEGSGAGARTPRRPRGRVRRGRAVRPTRARRRGARRLNPTDRQHPARERIGPMSIPAGKLPLPELGAMKRRGEKIVVVTAYDAPGARFAEDAGIDV